MSVLENIDAYAFDVFGTLTDFLTSVSAAVEHHANGKLSHEKALEFTKEWRKLLMTKTWEHSQFRDGVHAPNIDQLHRETLELILLQPQWTALAATWASETKKKELVQTWHRLAPWADVPEGLKKVKQHAIIVALSNGSVRLLIDLQRYAQLPFDAIFSAEMLGVYKPNPQLYKTTPKLLSLSPSRVALVATHPWDLRAAASHGLKTIYLRREAHLLLLELGDRIAEAKGISVDATAM